MENNKILLMRFKKEDSKVFSLSIRNPKENLTEEEIKTVMDYIVENSLILPANVHIKETIDAKITSTNVEKLDLVL